ncbi:sodium/calcium exchanger 3-like [Dermacentor variabilis]|uniref:sodium/calcium exchanger 3-like n=1 Tax=Dermacentor variabilis TaxID=34621 RepID=UPI003F5BC7D8
MPVSLSACLPEFVPVITILPTSTNPPCRISLCRGVAEPGIFELRRRGLLVRESVGTAQVAVVRTQGAGGTAYVHWRTRSQTAKDGEDFHGGEGKLVFEQGETVKNIDIPIVDDFEAEKDEHFEVELFDASPGSGLGHLTKTTVTITSDEGDTP